MISWRKNMPNWFMMHWALSTAIDFWTWEGMMQGGMCHMPDEIAEDGCEDAAIGRVEPVWVHLKHLALFNVPSTELKPEFRWKSRE